MCGMTYHTVKSVPFPPVFCSRFMTRLFDLSFPNFLNDLSLSGTNLVYLLTLGNMANL